MVLYGMLPHLARHSLCHELFPRTASWSARVSIPRFAPIIRKGGAGVYLSVWRLWFMKELSLLHSGVHNRLSFVVVDLEVSG